MVWRRAACGKAARCCRAAVWALWRACGAHSADAPCHTHTRPATPPCAHAHAHAHCRATAPRAASAAHLQCRRVAPAALDEQRCRHGVRAQDVWHEARHVLVRLTLTQACPGGASCVCVVRVCFDGGGGGREGGRVCWRALVCACVHVCASFGGGRSGGRITPHHMARRTRAHTTPGVSAARAPHLSKSSTASTAVSSRRMELAWHAARTSGNTMNALALCGHSGGGVCHVCVRVWLCADGCADVCCWVCCVCARRAALRACGAGVAHAHAHAHPAVHGAHLARCCTSRATQSPACPRCR
jgi:hypothetical protein